MYKVLYIYGNKFNNKETFFHRLIKLFHFYSLFFFEGLYYIKKIASKSLILLWKNYYFIHNIFLKFMSYLSVCEMLFNCYCGRNFNVTV